MSGEQLTLLPAESLASLSVWPGSKQAQQMTVTSGRKLLEYSRSCGRVGSALRTLVASSTWRSTTCLLTWHHKVTKQGRSYFQLRASVPRTSEPACGLLPTATASLANGGPAPWREGEPWWKQSRAARNLEALAQYPERGRVRPEGMWPTPRASEVEMRTYSRTPSQDAGKHGLYLQAEVLHAERQRLLPTPAARDYKDTGENVDYEKVSARSKLTGRVMIGELLPTPQAGDGPKHTVQGGKLRQEQGRQLSLSNRIGLDITNPQGLKLNPDFVSRMMGFPDGWLSLGVPNTIALLAQGRALQDWAWRADGTKVRVFQVQGQPWREVTRKTRAGKATP